MAYKLRKALLSHIDSIKPIAIKFFTKDPGFDMKLEVGSLRGPQSPRAKKKEPSSHGQRLPMCHLASVTTLIIILNMRQINDQLQSLLPARFMACCMHV